MHKIGWIQPDHLQTPTAKIPLQFNFPPVEIITKQLTKLNSTHPYRISYLGPRWQNSVIFHKKYSKNSAYPFKQSKLSKSSNFIHQSMSHNQFYKNQFYYRAFQGMNPTLNLSQELIFQSRFQCGNLDCSIKIKNNQYDLFLRIDSNTRGNIFWYYFSIRNPHQKKRVKLNICNLTKNGTHYSKGLNPFMFSSSVKIWSQQGMNNVTFQQKRLKYDFLYDKIKVDKFYQLSFQVDIEKDQEIKFAYCIPYGYSELLQDLEMIQNKQKVQIGILGQTLTGINIPIIMIGQYVENIKKQIIMISGRIHPGQSNTSLIISNLMKMLAMDQQMQVLRQNVIFIIIPMVNPDGVILGNSRTGAAGLDLNRQFKSKNKSLFPQIGLVKGLVHKIMEKDQIEIYLDIHGHSKKKNMFIYGPPYNVTQPEYYRCRVFPKILSNLTPLFRYYSCQFDIPVDKRSTARAVMLNQMLIPFVYTIQSSLGFYYDYFNHKTEVFTREKWGELGNVIVCALKEYYQGLYQYEQFLESKKKSRKNLSEDIKLTKEKTKDKESINKQIKLLKIFEQIKVFEQKRSKQQKKDKQIDYSSDSHDEHQNLQKQKFYQFGRMVTEFMQEQQNKIINQSQKPRAISRRDLIEHSPQTKKKNLQILKRRQKKWREQQQFLTEQLQINENKKKQALEANKKNRKSGLNKQQNYSIAVQRNQLSSQQIQRGLSLNNQKQKLIQRTKIIPKQQSVQQNYDFTGDKKFTSKMNIRMFNFQKTISNQKSIRYSQGKDISKAKELNIHKNKNLSELKKRFDQKKNLKQQLKKESLPNKSNFINLDYIQDDYSQQKQKQEQELSNSKSHKNKFLFPSSFYRIKYQHHKKKMETKKKNEEMQVKSQMKIKDERQLITIGLLQTNNSVIESMKENTKKQGLFVKINRFPLL